MIDILQLAPDGRLFEVESSEDARSRLCKDGCVTWVDLTDGSDAEWRQILKLYPFHPLAVDDCRSNAQRPKLEEYPGHLLIVFQGLELSGEGETLETTELDILLAPGLMVTVHDRPLRAIEEVKDRCTRSPDMFAAGADQLLHAVLDRTVDFYFPLAEKLEHRLDAIEDSLAEPPDPAMFDRIFKLKKHLLAFRRFVGPQRDIVNALSFRSLVGVRDATHIYFRDIHDHLIRLHDQLESMRDLSAGVLDAHMTQMSQRTNEIIKVLTIMGSIILPLSLLAGAFGMNFAVIPFAQHPYGFWIALGGMVGLGALIYGIFKLRRWV